MAKSVFLKWELLVQGLEEAGNKLLMRSVWLMACTAGYGLGTFRNCTSLRSNLEERLLGQGLRHLASPCYPLQ